jgi:hypothetical protein
MKTYQKFKNNVLGEPRSIRRIDDMSSIPFDPANTDYQRFKKDVNEGAELQDAEGNAMTEQQAKDFVKELS